MSKSESYFLISLLFFSKFSAYFDIQRVVKMISLIKNLNALSSANYTQYTYGIANYKVYLCFYMGET